MSDGDRKNRGADDSQVNPHPTRAARGVINSVTGQRDGKGIPDLFEGEIQHGEALTQIRMLTPRGKVVPVDPLQLDLRFRDFGQCPICLDTGPMTREHVPPQSIGGRVLTLTCDTCNNIFGSRYEPALQNWHDDAIAKLRFSGEAVPGSRNAGRVLVRQNERGEFVMFLTGGAPGVRELIENGQLQMEYVQTRGYELRIAALKTAYLTCCLILGQIPNYQKASQIRDELLAARDLPKGESPAPSELLSSLRINKSGQKPSPGKIHILASRLGDDSIAYALGFNRFWSVSWPLEMGAIVISDGDQHVVVGARLPSRTSDEPEG